MITIEMINEALVSLAGMVALGVITTQIFKDLFNKSNIKWVSHLISWLVALGLNGIALGICSYLQYGLYGEFNPENVQFWLNFVGNVAVTALCSNGTWSYEFAKKFLEWLNLLPVQTWKENVIHDDPEDGNNEQPNEDNMEESNPSIE